MIRTHADCFVTVLAALMFLPGTALPWTPQAGSSDDDGGYDTFLPVRAREFLEEPEWLPPDREDPLPTPYFPDGRVNLDGRAGEKGFWNVMRGAAFGTRSPGLPTNLELDEIPFQDWARDLYEYRQTEGQLYDPHASCYPAGGMRFFTVPNGLNIVQQPEMNRIYFISGENRDWRRIAMEPDRMHPHADEIVPSYFGDSIGWWEEDTLVVDTIGFNERFWMIRGGLPHTRHLHLIERFTRVDYDTLRYEFTVDDKGAYTEPWSGGWTIPWQRVNYDESPGGEIHEYFCHDNERDWEHFEQLSEEQ
jgi:hypothetical protein